VILQKEILDKAKQWGVPPDTADKDYVLGHFLSGFFQHFTSGIIFKGGTCLRKCYFPEYRFSEDLDFTAKDHQFELKKSDLDDICKWVTKHSGILLHAEEIGILQHNNIKKGYQVYIKYWGGNHSRNQQPPAAERWLTRIKLEISTEEICLLTPEQKSIHHPYSDQLINGNSIPCYPIREIVSEKLRSLVQRSYTAPRDFYDLYHLTNDYSKDEWKLVKSLFLDKMKHKNILFTGAENLVSADSAEQVKKAWNRSISHQMNSTQAISSDEIIEMVIKRMKENL